MFARAGHCPGPLSTCTPLVWGDRRYQSTRIRTCQIRKLESVGFDRLWRFSFLYESAGLESAQRVVVLNNTKPRRQYIKKSPRWAKPILPRKCSRCGISETPQWRQVNGQVVCNACGYDSATPLWLYAYLNSLKGGHSPTATSVPANRASSPPPEPVRWEMWPAAASRPTMSSTILDRMAIDFLLNPPSPPTT